MIPRLLLSVIFVAAISGCSGDSNVVESPENEISDPVVNEPMNEPVDEHDPTMLEPILQLQDPVYQRDDANNPIDPETGESFVMGAPFRTNPLGRTWRHTGHWVKGVETTYPDDYEGLTIFFNQSRLPISIPGATLAYSGWVDSTLFCREQGMAVLFLYDVNIIAIELANQVILECTPEQLNTLDTALAQINQFGDGNAVVALSKMYGNHLNKAEYFATVTVVDPATSVLTMTDVRTGLFKTYWELVE